jgi:hypothetical protein
MNFIQIGTNDRNSTEFNDLLCDKLKRQEIKILKSVILDYSNKEIA